MISGKRVLDVVGAAGLLYLTAPAWAFIALAIRQDDHGPVFFRQARLGRNGRVFTMWKFRTMRVDAPDLRNADGSTFNAAHDPRVTAIGQILRRTSLDELPQLLNVLRGEMSLVGPRPDLVDAREHYRAQDHARLSVLPGITGLAQVMGRNDLPWEARRDLDLEYVRGRSLRLDLKIVAKTFGYVLRQGGVFNPAGRI